MERDLSLINLEPYGENDGIPEQPEECAETEEAMSELRRVTQEDKFTFINVIVLSVVLLACAAYFISMTSSKKFSDEGNKFTPERLLNGKFTAEISSRYYSTIAYPEEIDRLAGSISGIYGFGDGIDYTNGGDTGAPENSGSNHTPAKPSGGSSGHKEETVTSASESETGTATEKPPEVKTFYDSVFSRTTTVSSELGWDPDDPYSHKTTPTTTINTTAPNVVSTTTEAPKDTAADTDTVTQSGSETVSSETETVTEPTQTETDTETSVLTCETQPPEIPSETETSAPSEEAQEE